MNLGHTLGLRPLDRVQVGSRNLVAEAEFRRQRSNDPAQYRLPFWYFQSVDAAGKLRLMAPNGYVDWVDPLDVVDVIRGTPVRVQAMPTSLYLERLRLPVSQQRDAAGPEWFRPASVLHAQRDRWGGFSYAVAFDEHGFNSAGFEQRFAPIRSDEREGLRRLTRRTRMPVYWRASGGRSADGGVERAEEKTRACAAQFVRSALSEDAGAVTRLLDVDVKG